MARGERKSLELIGPKQDSRRSSGKRSCPLRSLTELAQSTTKSRSAAAAGFPEPGTAASAGLSLVRMPDTLKNLAVLSARRPPDYPASVTSSNVASLRSATTTGRSCCLGVPSQGVVGWPKSTAPKLATFVTPNSRTKTSSWKPFVSDFRPPVLRCPPLVCRESRLDYDLVIQNVESPSKSSFATMNTQIPMVIAWKAFPPNQNGPAEPT